MLSLDPVLAAQVKAARREARTKTKADLEAAVVAPLTMPTAAAPGSAEDSDQLLVALSRGDVAAAAESARASASASFAAAATQGGAAAAAAQASLAAAAAQGEAAALQAQASLVAAAAVVAAAVDNVSVQVATRAKAGIASVASPASPMSPEKELALARERERLASKGWS
jgi:hypothetical protein